MTLTNILTIIALCLMAITTICYAYQAIYLFVPMFVKRKKPEQAEKQHKFAILIAARNEEAVLPHLLKTIRDQDYPAELITTYVIADNCTDATARVAAEGGAHVYERFNTEQVGKGYALNYLIDHIRAEEGGLERYDAFMIFDADNLLDANFMTQINITCDQGYGVFGSFRNTKNFGTNWISSGHAMWYLHDSVHLNQSRYLLGNPCFVTGTGFGFTRETLEKAGGNWKFFTLTEDIEFSAWLSYNGIRSGYNHDAILYDEQPESFKLSWRQRTRWVQGGNQVGMKHTGKLLKGIFQGGHSGYGCLEMITLTLLGYGFAALSAVFSFIVTFIGSGFLGLAVSLVSMLLGTYVSMLLIGVLTVIPIWNRIRDTEKNKVLAVITFPIYVATFVPIAVTAVFRKRRWAPIAHTVAISTEDMGGKK